MSNPPRESHPHCEKCAHDRFLAAIQESALWTFLTRRGPAGRPYRPSLDEILDDPRKDQAVNLNAKR